MNEQLRPIETNYRGYRFRSQLEARWAVFMDAAAIPWEYEAQGFNLGGVYYLPDFWLPRDQIFLEIKPCKPGAYRGPHGASCADAGAACQYQQLRSLSDHRVTPTPTIMILIVGIPGHRSSGLHQTKVFAARDCLSVRSVQGFRSDGSPDRHGMQCAPVVPA